MIEKYPFFKPVAIINLSAVLLLLNLCINSCSKPETKTGTGDPSTGTITITTSTVGYVTLNSARCGGHISSDGGVGVTARGICWSTSPKPTTANNITLDGTGTGFYFTLMTGLSLSTTYYVRAYATNSLGTTYGNELSFTTAATIVPPSFVTTTPVTAVTPSTAVSGGQVGLDGGSAISARGVCWNTSPAPTIADAKTNNGTGEGDFISNLTGLTQNTRYYVRAYATNAAGTSYGEEWDFKTPEPGTVFIGGSDNNFYAINVVTGQLKWRHTGTASFNFSGPVYANGKIYAGSFDGSIYCMDTLNGNVKWTYQTGSGIGSDPVIDNGTIFFGSSDKYLYALDAETGILKWRFLTGASIGSSPVVNNGVVYFGSNDFKVYALNTANGQLIWSYQTNSVISESGAAIANGLLYIGSRDGYLYALNINDGSLKWRYSIFPISFELSSPTVANNIVYIGGYRDVGSGGFNKGSLYALNASTGQLIWENFKNTSFNSSPIVADGKLYITTDAGDLIAANPANGALIWTKTIFSNGSSPAVLNGMIYIGGGGMNYIYGLDAASGLEKWRFSVTNSVMISGPCAITPSGISYSGKSGMQN